MNRKHLAPDDRVSSAMAQLRVRAKPLLAFSVVLLVAHTMIGCGTPGAPLAPSLNLPTPVLNLTAVRIGNSVRLAWSMPTRTTDKVILRHPVTAQVCRTVEAGSCADVASLTLKPGGAGEYVDALPANLTQGPGRLLRYEVAIRNHAGKSAGPSNIAYSAAGASPAALTGLTGQVRRDGVLLNWHPATEPEGSVFFRIERLQLTAAAPDQAPKSPLAPVAPAAAQTLVVHSKEGMDPGHAVDTSALFNQQYRYVLERVATLTLSGQSVEVQGLPSEAVVIATNDIFPPAVPQGLVAVADAAAGTIDLSWSPDSDSDLAAYQVYRRDIHTDLPPQRISSVGTETSFRDTGAQPEHTYAYSVSAVDQTGNESARSPEVEETLPKP
jgi:Fibronectin type III domain